MDDTKGSKEAQAIEAQVRREESFKGTCPYCLSVVDVHFDIKHRPYWRCWRCEIRLFGTKTALKSLQGNGWIWKDERPFEALRAWFEQVAITADLKKKRKR